MTTTPKVVKVTPALLPEDRFARNGKTPAPMALNRIVHVLNHASHNLKRPLCSGRVLYADLPKVATSTALNPASLGTATTMASFCVHTSENCDKIRVHIHAQSPGNAAIVPQALIQADDGSTTAESSVITVSGYGVKWGDAANLRQPQHFLLDVSVDPDTEYMVHILAGGYFAMYGFAAWEVANVDPTDALDGFAATKPFEEGKPVYYPDVQKLLQTATKLWQHNGATAFSHCMFRTDRTVSTATYSNLCDQSYTAYSANAPGFFVRSTYHSSARSTVVPYKLMCFGERSAGTGTLQIKLVNSGGTLVEWTGITDTWSPFQSTTFTSTPLNGKVDILAKTSDGASTTFKVYNVALIEYEA